MTLREDSTRAVEQLPQRQLLICVRHATAEFVAALLQLFPLHNHGYLFGDELGKPGWTPNGQLLEIEECPVERQPVVVAEVVVAGGARPAAYFTCLANSP